MIEKAIYSLLNTTSTITDIVGTNIYPLIRQQEDGLPALTYQMISGVPAYDISGPNGYVESRVQINCFASTYLGAAELAIVVWSALNGFKGSAAGITIDCILLDNINDLPVINPENEEMNVFAKTIDFFISYKEI